MSEATKRFGEQSTKFIVAAGGTLLLAKCIFGFIAALVTLL